MLTVINDVVEYVKLGRQFRKFRPYTMIHDRPFRENLLLAKKALLNPALDGAAIVECGTWKGGMAAALVEIGGPNRTYYFFDSFEGLPAAEAIDGKSAKDYQADTKNPEYFDNCRASVDDLKGALALATNRTDRIRIIPGFFESSFKEFEPPQIAVLRLDGDWYSSTMICLQKFWNYVLPGGLILIDDYYTWDGCARAVHEFLFKVEATERVQQGRISGSIAFIQKQEPGQKSWRNFIGRS
jgi:O-methyltransferase